MLILRLFLNIGLAAAVYDCADQEEYLYQFPKDFLWSTASAAYQVEGAAHEDGRGLSIWDIFSHTPGKIKDNSTGDIACDSYHRLDDDFAQLVNLGVKSYRFSISWSRIFPDGRRGSLNPAGVAYYHKLIDGLRARKIEPLVTMYHWDLPQALQDEGGWLNREIVEWFADYARFLFEEYGDKVNYWLTLNEPSSMTLFGHCGTITEHAPGGLHDHCSWAPYLAGHHMILAHAETYHIYQKEFKEKQKGKAKIGMANVSGFVVPFYKGDNETVARARHMKDFWFMDPFFFGDYPPLMRAQIDRLSAEEGRARSRLPTFTEEEKEKLKGCLDFLGINYYITLKAKPVTEPITGKNWYHPDFYIAALSLDNVPIVRGGWIRINPEGLESNLIELAQRYFNTPILITENGCMDSADDFDPLEDNTRILYIDQHIQAVGKAIQAGVNVIGYNVWTLMDNYEWTGGYTDNSRFGLYRTDFTSPNLTRTPKKSVSYYKGVIAQHGVKMCGSADPTVEIPTTTSTTNSAQLSQNVPSLCWSICSLILFSYLLN